jgi:arylsulfatase/uncharacterized sulfatase
MRVPQVVAGDPLSVSQAVSNVFPYVTDVTSTLLDLSQVNQPAEKSGGSRVERFIGRSLSSHCEKRSEK